jgi:hypothetical protein
LEAAESVARVRVEVCMRIVSADIKGLAETPKIGEIELAVAGVWQRDLGWVDEEDFWGLLGSGFLWEGGREAANRIVCTWRLAVLLECASDCIYRTSRKAGQCRAGRAAGMAGLARQRSTVSSTERHCR